MAERHPEQRVWCKVRRRGRAGVARTLELIDSPEKFFEEPPPVEHFDDFHYSGTIANNERIGQWQAGVAGAAASITATSTFVDSTNRVHGMLTLDTGTDPAASTVSLRHFEAGTLFGFATYRVAARIRLPVLSTAAQEYIFTWGWHDLSNTRTADAVDGCYFMYNRAAFGDAWAVVNRNNNAQTGNVPGLAVDVNAFHTLEIMIEEDGTSCWYYVDGERIQTISQVGGTTTNIPVGAGRQTGLGLRIFKTVGATARLCHVDWIRTYYDRTGRR